MLSRFTHNWNLKMTSLVLAIALWSHVRGEVNPVETEQFRVPLQTTAPRATLVTGGAPPRWVLVTLRAPRQSLRDLRELNGVSPGALANPLGGTTPVELRGNGVQARLDFSNAGRGTVTVPIQADCRVPDAQVVGVSPRGVALQLDRAARALSSVRLQLQMDADYAARSTSVSPSRVTLYGASAQLSRVASVSARVRTQARTGEQTGVAALRAVDARGVELSKVSIEPPTARVRLLLFERLETRDVRLLMQTRGAPARGFRVSRMTAKPATLRVRGPRRLLRAMNALPLTVNVEGANGERVLRVTPRLPDGVQTLKPERVLVRVSLTRRAVAAATPPASVALSP